MPDGWQLLPAWLELDVLGRLLLALALGALVGFEREMRGKPAGLRTVILITVGAELFTEASLIAASMTPHDLIRADPGRIAAQIVSGIGFIGAGTILVHRGAVVGLTTAASLWVAAGIGLLVGLQSYMIAVGGTILVMLTLTVLGWIEHRLLPDISSFVLDVTLRGGEDADRAWLTDMFEERDLEARPVELELSEGVVRLAYRLKGPQRARTDLMRTLFKDERVRAIHAE